MTFSSLSEMFLPIINKVILVKVFHPIYIYATCVMKRGKENTAKKWKIK